MTFGIWQSAEPSGKLAKWLGKRIPAMIVAASRILLVVNMKGKETIPFCCVFSGTLPEFGEKAFYFDVFFLSSNT